MPSPCIGLYWIASRMGVDASPGLNPCLAPLRAPSRILEPWLLASLITNANVKGIHKIQTIHPHPASKRWRFKIAPCRFSSPTSNGASSRRRIHLYKAESVPKIKYKVDPAVPCSRKPRSPPPPPLPRFSVECFRNRRQCHSTQDVQGLPECRLPGPHPSHRQACLLPMPPTYSGPRVHHTPDAYGRGHQTLPGCPSCRRFLGTTLQTLRVPNHTAKFAAAATAMLGRAPRDKPR